MRRVIGFLTVVFCSRLVLAQPAPEANAPFTHPSVVPPRLLHFERAIYPRMAQQLGLEASVVLLLTIDPAGRVRNVDVREPAGHGFDEAAVEAATRFVFEPAVRAGVPIAARILYRYQFKLEPSELPAKGAQTAAPPRLGELRGTVVAGTPPAPLAGVKLNLRANGVTKLSVTTAIDGTWLAPNLDPGQYIVEIEVSGYRRVSQLEQVEDGKVTSVTYGLETSDELPLEVTVRGAALKREVTHYEIPRTELLRVPGTLGDAIHAVEAMPSVARPRGLSGDLIVRGSAAGDSQVYVEGTPIPQVFHYGDLSSVVPGEMIERLEFYPSNFSVRYGRAMGGIVEARLRQTNPDDRFHGTAQVDLINARFNVEGPIPKMQDWSFMGGARTSYFDQWLSPILRDGASSEDGLPRYYDYQLYLEKRLAGNGVYRVGFIGARDTFVPILKNRADWYVPRQSSFDHFQSQLRLPIFSRIDVKASWSIGRNRSHVAEDERSTTTTYTLGTLRSEVSVKTGNVGIARLGTDALYAPFTVKAYTDRKSSGGELVSNDTGNPTLVPYDIRGVYLRPAVYAEYEWAPSRRIDLTLGTRFDYTKDTRDVDVAPRFAARYVLIDGPLGTVLKGGFGWFYQPPDPSQTLRDLGTKGLTSSRAIHSMLGVEQALTKHVQCSVEAFEKELRELEYVHEDGSGNETTDNSGRGRVWGADLLLRYRGEDRFFGWVAYTLSRSTRKPSTDKPEELYRYDQTHILNLLGSYRLGRGWEVGGRFRYATGLPYDACSQGLFNNATGDYRCFGTQHQKRLAPFHRLDLRLEKVFQFATYRLSAYIDILNAYGHYSPDKAVENYDYSGVKPLSRSLPFLPSIGLRGEI
jgi:TonB family protein